MTAGGGRRTCKGQSGRTIIESEGAIPPSHPDPALRDGDVSPRAIWRGTANEMSRRDPDRRSARRDRRARRSSNLYSRLELRPLAAVAIMVLERGPTRFDEKVNRGGVADI
jgi:hypothetical protein